MNKTAAEVEREVEASRSDLNRTVEALKDKMTPGQLFDEATHAMGGAGQQVLSKLFEQAKENPMPLAVMGLGLAWLMSGAGKSSGGPRYSGYEEPRSFSGGGVGTGLSERAHALGDKASDAMSGAKDRLGDFGGDMADRGRRALHTVGDAAGMAADRAADYGGQAKQAFGNILEREPLIIGALGLVVGAAIGASLPHTAAEDHAIGPLRDKVLDKGQDMAQDGLQQVSGVAQAVYESAKGELQNSSDEAGGSPAERAADIAAAAIRAGKDEWESSPASSQQSFPTPPV